MKRYVIGVDVGTTCTKAVLVDENGTVIGHGSKGYSLISDGLKIEQRAEDWIEATIIAVRNAVQGENPGCVAALSLSTQGATTVAVDENHHYLGNAWTWMDNRSAAELEEAKACLGEDYIYNTTGWRANPALDLAKIRRMSSLPEYSSAVKYLTTIEVMNHWLTGQDVIDPSNAAIRQLYHVKNGAWDERLLEVAQVTLSQLPEVKPTGILVGKLREAVAERLGLPAGVPIYNGAHDQYCAALGTGAIHDGDLLLSAGTTWALMAISKQPIFTASYVAPGQHPVKGLYGAIASLEGSGASMQWFKNYLIPEEYEILNEEVAGRRDRTAGLMFYPYLSGAKYPLWKTNAKGTFTGITLEHDRFDFARAIMEGVAFGVRRALADFEENGARISAIIMMGGAAKSPVWTEILSAVCRLPVILLEQPDAGAVGAAAIAACGAEIFKDYGAACSAMVKQEAVILPNEEDAAWYEEKFRRYMMIWNHLSAYYDEEREKEEGRP